MPASGGVQSGGLWYTIPEWQAMNGLASSGTANGAGTGLSARGIIDGILDPIGMQSLSDWAWNAFNQAGGGDGGIAYVNSQLPQQQAYKDRFPEAAITAANGDAWTPAQIIAAEQQTAQQLHAAGLDGLPGYDAKTVTAANIEGNVSNNEFQARLDARAAAAQAQHPDVAAQLNMLGINGQAALTAYVTDPINALPMIQQQIAAAQAAAAGVNSGFGQINAAQAIKIAQSGSSPSQDQSTFTQLGQLKQLQTALPGESGNGISTDTFLGAGFQGSATDQAAIQAEQQRRSAQFQTKGSFAATQAGISGLGSAAQ